MHDSGSPLGFVSLSGRGKYAVKKEAIISDMGLPTSAKGITPQWLTEALAWRYPGVEVRSADIVDFIPGTSSKFRVRLEYNDCGRSFDLPSTMIVKGGFESHSPSMREMYLNEIRAYRDVLPFVTMNAPRCYFAGVDPAEDAYQAIVIMEDLTASGARFCDPLRPQTYAQVARRLDAMALYHAQTWDSPEFRPGGRFDWIDGRHEAWSLVYRDRYLKPDVWQHYMDSPRGAAVSVSLRDGDRMRAALDSLAEYHRGFPVCLANGDTHLGNLYEEADGTPGFFDMQLSRGPWQLDVAYHIVCALDIPDRRRWEQSLLTHYLARLAAHGVRSVPDFDTAMAAYRREIVYGLFIFLINETRFQTEAVNTAYAARFSDAAIQHRSLELLC